MKPIFFATFLIFDEDIDPIEETYKIFIQNYLVYCDLFEHNAMGVNEILDTPFMLFNDLINMQTDFKKKKYKQIEEMKKNAANTGGGKSGKRQVRVK